MDNHVTDFRKFSTMYYTDNILTLIFFMQTVATVKMQTHNTYE